MSDTENSRKELQGVCCDAVQCVHHGRDNTCHAKGISVGPHSAESVTETVCATFKAKSDPLCDITGDCR